MRSLVSQAFAPVFRALGPLADAPHGSDSPADPSVDHTVKHFGAAPTAAGNILPDIHYPSPFTVKNTFIDELDRPFFLEGFLTEREVSSCPVSAIDQSLAEHRAPKLLLFSKRSDRQRSCKDEGGSSYSRSTSAGSSSRHSSTADRPGVLTVASPDSREDAQRSHEGASTCRSGLPEIEYPSPFSVKHTFIHADIGRPLSLDGFFQERQLHSCPASGICAPPGLDEEEHVSEHGAVGKAVVEALTAVTSSAVPPPPAEPPILSAQPQLPTTCPPAQAPRLSTSSLMDIPVLLLSEAVLRPALGSRELPTVGSDNHRSGTCNPCAHAFGAKGCRNGVECPFCHLCPKGELKRRQHTKRLAKRKALGGVEAGGLSS